MKGFLVALNLVTAALSLTAIIMCLRIIKGDETQEE